jgi:hypothetical protein
MWLLYLPYYFDARPDEAYRHKAHFYITQDPFGKFWQGYEHRIALIFTVFVAVLLIAMRVALAAGDMPRWFKDGCLVISYGVIILILGYAALFMVYMLLWVNDRLWGFLRLQLIRNYRRRHNDQRMSFRSRAELPASLSDLTSPVISLVEGRRVGKESLGRRSD